MLWDVSNGTTVTDTSGVLNYYSSYRSDITNMFGGRAGTIEVGNTLFKDYMLPGYQGGSVPAGYIHYVEWKTMSEIILRSFNLVASNEGMNRRAFNHFELYVGDGSDNWTSIYEAETDPYTPGPTYTHSNELELAVDLATAVSAQYFRAEFVQAPWTDQRAVGPRIVELDGYNTFLDGSTGTAPVPESATLILFGSGLSALSWLRRKTRNS